MGVALGHPNLTMTVWMRLQDGGFFSGGRLEQQAVVANKVGGALVAACSVCSCTRPVVDGLGLARVDIFPTLAPHHPLHYYMPDVHLRLDQLQLQLHWRVPSWLYVS